MSLSDELYVSRQNMPLFKYLHPDRTDVLRSQSIRFSSPAVLNDPFELKPHLARLASPEYMAAEMAAEVDRSLPRILREELDKLPLELRSLISAKSLTKLLRRQLPEAQIALEGISVAMLPLLQQAMAHKLEELIGILCLSQVNDSLLMWAHYADSHRGFVVEFDESSSFLIVESRKMTNFDISERSSIASIARRLYSLALRISQRL